MLNDPRLVLLIIGFLVLLAWVYLSFFSPKSRRNPSPIPQPDEPAIDSFGLRYPLSPEHLLFVLGAGLLVPFLYNTTVDPKTELVFAEPGYGLCDVQPFTRQANAAGPDDDTATVLRSLTKPPGGDDAKMILWSSQIGALLKSDKEVTNALIAAIIRSNFTPEDIIDYCAAQKKPDKDRTGEEQQAFKFITSTLGYEP